MIKAVPVRLYRSMRSHFRTGNLTATATIRCRPPLPLHHRLTSLHECRLLAGPAASTPEGAVVHLAVEFHYAHCGQFGPAVLQQCRVPVDLTVRLPEENPPGQLQLAPETRLRGADVSSDGQQLCASLLILATWQPE